LSSKKPSREKREDHSAIAKLVEDFGLLLLHDSYERYIKSRQSYTLARLEGTLANYTDEEDTHLEKYIPILPYLGIHPITEGALYHHWEIIERFDMIETFIRTLDRTADFKTETTAIWKRLKRKFSGRRELWLTYKTDRLISDELCKHCRDITSCIREFRPPAEEGSADTLWDVNIWSIILEADSRHRETGTVHSAFFEYLNQYQSLKGGGSPRAYKRKALTVLLAECFEDFDTEHRKPQINHNLRAITKSDTSKDTRDSRPRRAPRKEYYSDFADFLIKFCEVTQVVQPPSRQTDALSHYRTILRNRLRLQIPRITERIHQHMKAPQVIEIIEILDHVKA
jgi:hypothetical protein